MGWQKALLFLPVAAAQLVFQPQHIDNTNGTSRAIPVNITHLANNRGFGKGVGDANYDGYNSCYPAEFLPPATFVYDGFKFSFPQYRSSGNDNVISDGQTVQVPKGKYVRVSMLASAETGLATGSINATYADGSMTDGEVLVPSWWSWPYPFGGDLVFPYYLSNQSVDYNRSNIFQTTNWLDSSKDLSSISLPVPVGSGSGPGGAAVGTRLHIFAISLLPVEEATSSDTPQLEVQYARTTQKWVEGTNKTQVVEVIVNNVGSSWLLSNQTVNVTVQASGLQTVQPAQIKRLAAGDQTTVEVGVVNNNGTPVGATGTATIVLETPDGSMVTNHTFDAVYGIVEYDATYESVYGHESPDWYNGAKYGIFIHWGVYSVPGWGNVGPNESYAEWYWYDLNEGPDTTVQTYEYHLKTYGPNVLYDDFIANFSASVWDPREWVDLFADAGAQYFVQVSKHHDGYAIFDVPANSSKRSSVALNPHRDFVAELFAAAKEYQPHLHRATYFSLPEWFNPDYRSLGFGSWPGGNATNPFTNETLPYTGFVHVEDFVSDLILPEMQTLASDPRYEIEIMWCDIGGPNKTAEFASQWYNEAASTGRQVSMNARCGLPGDFDTPEYARYSAVQRRKWESNLGMDPFSYGYNRATPLASYMNASTIVTSLIDIVSKNGNFLLDVGPTANGTIIDVEQRHLREAGQWISSHAEAIFNTTYWSVTPQYVNDNTNTSVRFTLTMDAFYIHVLNQTTTGFVDIENVPVPWVENDEVTIVGGNMTGATVGVERLMNSNGIRLNVTDEIWNADKWAWVFKITY